MALSFTTSIWGTPHSYMQMEPQGMALLANVEESEEHSKWPKLDREAYACRADGPEILLPTLTQ